MADDRAAPIKQIKDANDIVKVVGGYIALQAAGSVFKGLCPFHNDSRPSFQVAGTSHSVGDDPFHRKAFGSRDDSFSLIRGKAHAQSAPRMRSSRVGNELAGMNPGFCRLLRER